MKTAKRSISVLLCLLMGLALLAPLAAAEETEAWAFTKLPGRLWACAGRTLALEAEAPPLEESEAEIAYTWFRCNEVGNIYNGPIAEGAAVQLPTEKWTTQGVKDGEVITLWLDVYYCVTAENLSTGETLKSNPIKVTMFPDFGTAFLNGWLALVSPIFCIIDAAKNPGETSVLQVLVALPTLALIGPVMPLLAPTVSLFGYIAALITNKA